ncbi:MAG: TonB-dependent receptor plug domain-containing protein, partial [Bacteroidota bacterium]
MRILLFVVFILTSSQPLFAQRQLIVRDAVNHQAISGAQIVLFTSSSISGLQLRTTGTSGRAWLPDSVVSDSVTILASGYLDQKVVFNSQAEILVLLQPQAYSIDLAQVELSAYASGKNLLEQSGGISFISAAELARENDVILTPALNRVPGVYMHSGALNTNRISIRGIGARSLFSTSKIRAYLNDIPISTGDGETTIEDIDLSLIDRIEVIKGPASSMYGAALGGTINLQTGLGTLDEVRINNQLTLGSFGLLRNTLQADVSGQKQRIRLGYNQTQSDGYRDNNEYDRQGFSIIGQWLPSADEEISLILNYTDLLAFIPSSIDSATF